MKANLFRRLTVVALVVAGLAFGTGAATAASHAALPAKAAAIPTVFDLNGTYHTGTAPRPAITAPGDGSLRVNISGRPTAIGAVLNSTTIMVSFPDDSIFTAKLTAPGTIRWSNGTTWTKLSLRAPSIFNLDGNEASTVIRNAGLTVGIVRVLVDYTCWHDYTVIRQSPSAGVLVVPGQAMDFTIGILADTCP